IRFSGESEIPGSAHDSFAIAVTLGGSARSRRWGWSAVPGATRMPAPLHYSGGAILPTSRPAPCLSRRRSNDPNGDDPMRNGHLGLRRLSRPGSTQPRRRSSLRVEELETRLVPAVNFTETNLVTDNPAFLASHGFTPAAHTDPNLVNPWGMALG